MLYYILSLQRSNSHMLCNLLHMFCLLIIICHEYSHYMLYVNKYSHVRVCVCVLFVKNVFQKPNAKYLIIHLKR